MNRLVRSVPRGWLVYYSREFAIRSDISREWRIIHRVPRAITRGDPWLFAEENQEIVSPRPVLSARLSLEEIQGTS